MKATDAQIESAAKAMHGANKLIGLNLTLGHCRALARLGIDAALRAEPEQPIGAVTPASDL